MWSRGGGRSIAATQPDRSHVRSFPKYFRNYFGVFLRPPNSPEYEFNDQGLRPSTSGSGAGRTAESLFHRPGFSAKTKAFSAWIYGLVRLLPFFWKGVGVHPRSLCRQKLQRLPQCAAPKLRRTLICTLEFLRTPVQPGGFKNDQAHVTNLVVGPSKPLAVVFSWPSGVSTIIPWELTSWTSRSST